MDYIPNTAVAMAIGILIIIWAFLLHMILNQAPDAHLRFMLDLMDVRGKQSRNSPPRGSSPSLPGEFEMETSHEAHRSAAHPIQRHSAQCVQREVPLLFTASLRGREL